MPKQQVSSFLREARWLSSSSASAYAESQTTQYDGYQQAWRLLGYFVDCYHQQNGNENEDQNGGGSNSCQRYLLWGAYVDPNYEGGGVNEYQYYRNGQYDQTACADGTRCAKMDCHEMQSSFQLLGVFKQAYYASEWFPTLLQHQCVLDGTTYGTISAQEAQWPEGCTYTGVSNRSEDGAVAKLYLDVQSSVTLHLTLYTDSKCKVEYTGGDVSIDRLASRLGLPSSEQEMQWNKALEPFYYCQPCMAIDLSSAESRDRHLEEENVPFACYDNAGEVGVNQCAAFRDNTQMEAASWHDLDIAAKQGGLTQITLGDQTIGMPLSQVSSSSSRNSSPKHAPLSLVGLAIGGTFFVLSAAFLMITINWKLAKRKQRAIEQRRVLAEPLVAAKKSPPRLKTTASF